MNIGEPRLSAGEKKEDNQNTSFSAHPLFTPADYLTGTSTFFVFGK
jgi:hypothetical protein